MIHHPLRRALPAAVAALTICAVTSALPAKPLAAADLVTMTVWTSPIPSSPRSC
ncbi:MAG: hypothetical protein IKI21_03440 [Oscillospiraceae bacterium]|nr:hypothetical protein [Oscillospiraceae bacterium]